MRGPRGNPRSWVGCVLPLFATTDDPKVSQQTKGVLSRQDEAYSPGFVVCVIDAVRELESHNAAAAQWWRQNTPHLIQPGQLLVLSREACELVEEIETSA